MVLYSVFDEAFKPYGHVVENFPVDEILKTLANTPLPEKVGYVPSEPMLQTLPVTELVSKHLYGGMPVQMGWCNGHNTKLNCLEYHRDSEFNLGTEDFILLLAKQDEIENGVLDTEKVKAFVVPKGVLVEVYATSLHYAPCQASKDTGFRVLIALPMGTNGDKPDITPVTEEDRLLWASNKWLLAHSDTTEAAEGAYVGLTGDNIDILSII
ncbi:MAG: DUF4867 family protein [Clostridia bacterium]|nr:DUF4867 family protein [Clostridia bacterium]